MNGKTTDSTIHIIRFRMCDIADIITRVKFRFRWLSLRSSEFPCPNFSSLPDHLRTSSIWKKTVSGWTENPSVFQQAYNL